MTLTTGRDLCCVLLAITFIILLFLQNLDTDGQVPANSHWKNLLQSYSYKDNQRPADQPADPHPNSQFSTRIYNSTEVEQRFSRRRDLLHQLCAETDYSSYGPVNNSGRYHGQYDIFRTPLRWCLTRKVGSTYMNKLRKKLRENPPTSQTTKDFKTFMFTREPYSRLFSAYIDKFVTKPILWTFANNIINKFRKKRPEDPKFRCGHDATFTEFLQYFVYSEATGWLQDPHFTTIHRVCDVCHHNIDFVGKLETMREDLRYIFSLVNRSSEIQFDNNVQTLYRKCGMIRRNYENAISNFSGCIEFCPMVKNLWWSFQARGILPEGVKFPWTLEKCENLTGAEFRETTTEIYKAAKGSYDSHAQKDKFLRQMFAQVPLTVRLQVRDTLRRDCDMFGYVLQPEAVFPEFYD